MAALVAVSIQDLRPNPQDTSAFYLQNIYQLLADPNISRTSILATPAKPPPFSPPKYAIWVNSFWFLSLVINLTCAMLATLLQQWARRYVTMSHPPRSSPQERARIRAFFAEGIDKLHLPLAVEALPTLLHASLFLFFSGLLVFLFNINHTVFSFVAWWIGLSAVVYGCITMMPIFRHDSPYYAPLSSSAWFIYTGVSYGVFHILAFTTSLGRFWTLKTTYRKRLLGGIVRTAQESASELSVVIDRRVLKWTFDALDADDELEQFFDGIPGFCNSRMVDGPRNILSTLSHRRLEDALSVFRSRTLSSRLLSETVRERQLTVYMNAAQALGLPIPTFDFLSEIFKQGMDRVSLRSVQLGHSLRSRCSNSDQKLALYAQGIVAGIIANAPERNYRWKALVMGQLGISEDVLQDYLTHDDSVFLANFIYIIRQFFRFYQGNRRVSAALDLILPAISGFDVQDTLPELQHDFCALWNEIVLEERKGVGSMVLGNILRPIEYIHIALHRRTDAGGILAAKFGSTSLLYPLCNTPDHHSHPNDAAVGATSEITRPPNVLPPDIVRNPTTHSASSDVSPSPVLNPDHIRIHLADEPSLHDVPYPTAVFESSHRRPPVNVENNHVAATATSLNSAIPVVTQGPADTVTISLTPNLQSDPLPALAAATCIPELSFTLPSSSTVVSQHSTDLGAVPPSSSKIMPGISLSSFPTTVASDPVLVEPQSSLATPLTYQIDQPEVAPGHGHELLPSTSGTTTPLTPRPETSVSQPNMAPNDATFDTHDNSQTPDRNNAEAPQHAHQP
jgi:hypothetical protein